MRKNVWGVVVLALALALSGCGDVEGKSGGHGGTGGTGGTGGDGATGGMGGTGGDGGMGGDGGTGGVGGTIAQVARVVVEPDEVSVIEHQSARLTALAFDENDESLTDVVFDWSSSDEAIATVSEDGVVTTLRPGVATIVAQTSSHSGSAVVTVLEADIAAFEIPTSSTDLSVDGTLQLEARALDADGNILLGRTIAWTTSDADVATVANGVVSGIDLGTATITATLDGHESTVLVSVVHRFVEVVAGSSHTCALNAAGAAWCWGANWSGELGVDDTEFLDSNVPVRVSVEPGLRFTSLVAGDGFSCGLTAEGDVWCWGSNGNSQLGVDSIESSSVPTLAPNRRFTAISVMSYGVCGLDQAGAAFCWGYNSSDYELGDPNLTDDSAVPVAVSAPVEDEQPLSFVRLAHGEYHSCGLTAAGGLHCWGYNNRGRLGDGSTESRGRPVSPLAEATVVAYGAGNGHTCAATADGTTWCWGGNSSRQSADSEESQVLEPMVRFDASGFLPVAFALGDSHSCGLDASGAVWCWGRNVNGMLGRSDETSSEPRPIDGGLSFRTITSRSTHTCGIATDDKVYCWGNNEYGMLGAVTTDDFSAAPVPVFGQ